MHFLDGYISVNQRFFSAFLSKITKYNRVHLRFDSSVVRLLGHDPTPRPTCPVYRTRKYMYSAKCILRYISNCVCILVNVVHTYLYFVSNNY